MISLYGYKVVDIVKETILEDNRKIANKIIVLDLDKALDIEIIYNKESPIFKDNDTFLSNVNFENFYKNEKESKD